VAARRGASQPPCGSAPVSSADRPAGSHQMTEELAIGMPRPAAVTTSIIRASPQDPVDHGTDRVRTDPGARGITRFPAPLHSGFWPTGGHGCTVAGLPRSPSSPYRCLLVRQPCSVLAGITNSRAPTPRRVGGAVPQTAVRGGLTSRLCAGLPDFAPHSPDDRPDRGMGEAPSWPMQAMIAAEEADYVYRNQ
jgi:hypothetical protein